MLFILIFINGTFPPPPISDQITDHSLSKLPTKQIYSENLRIFLQLQCWKRMLSLQLTPRRRNLNGASLNLLFFATFVEKVSTGDAAKQTSFFYLSSKFGKKQSSRLPSTTFSLFLRSSLVPMFRSQSIVQHAFRTL